MESICNNCKHFTKPKRGKVLGRCKRIRPRKYNWKKGTHYNYVCFEPKEELNG